MKYITRERTEMYLKKKKITSGHCVGITIIHIYIFN